MTTEPPSSTSPTVVLVFTDIEGSTPLWERASEAMEKGLDLHNASMRRLITEHRGYEVKTEGDAFMVAFDTADDAVKWCLATQEALHALGWPAALLNEPEAAPSSDGLFRGLRVRMGVHLGGARRGIDPTTGRTDFLGAVVNRAARVSQAAHGGQVLVSNAVLEEASAGRREAVCSDLGEHRLRGMEQVERLWQVLPRRLAGRRFPPPATLDPHRTNLAPRPSSFMGRRADLQGIQRLFEKGSRLVTLLGPGGSGKTRLACRYGAQQLFEYQPGGVWFVDLSEARALAGLLRAVSVALSVPLTAGATEADGILQLGNAMAGRGSMLLVLDNFEQVVNMGPRTVDEWLRRAPYVRFLVTSRESLRLEGEAVWEVGPLSRQDAVDLFIDRARAVRPGFAPRDAERATIAKIADRLDGLPLAIELAAARASVMSPAVIEKRLAERFRLLTAGRRDAGDRQATLMGAIDWSWDLLSGWEKEALAQCSVFRGGFTLEAAEAVIDISAWHDAPWPMDAVQALVEKSLVRRVSSPDEQAEVRFGLYESIREYAARKLREPALVEARHGTFYARLGEEEPLESLHGPAGVGAFRMLEEELDNLASAARRAARKGELETAAKAALAASEVFELRGPFELGTKLLSEALSTSPGDRLAARLKLRRGLLARLAGRHDQARAAFNGALAAFQRLGVRRFEGIVLGNLGVLHGEQSRLEEARESYEAALKIHREVGDRRFEGMVLGNLGILLRQQGRMNEAREHYEAALKIHREVGNRRFEGVVLGNLGILHAEQGRMDEARDHNEAALKIHREVGHRRFEGLVLGNLGLLHYKQGRIDEARVLYEAALEINRAIGDRRTEGHVLGDLGMLLEHQGRMDEAREHYEAALLVHREVGNRRFEGVVLGNLGNLHAERSRVDEARTCFDAGEALLREAADPIELGKLLCKRARFTLAEGSREDASQTLDEAEALATNAGAGPSSELGRLLVAVRRLGEEG